MQHVDLLQQVVESVEDGTAMCVREGHRLIPIAGMHADEFRIRAVDAVEAFDIKVGGETGTNEAGPDRRFFHVWSASTAFAKG